MGDNKDELFPLTDDKGYIKGHITRKEAHGGGGHIHPVVHLHVFNTKGELYLQQRPEWKDIQPGKWDTAVGGHIDYDECYGDDGTLLPSLFAPSDDNREDPAENCPIKKALRREVREELGILDFKPVFLGFYLFKSGRERELVFVFHTVYDGVVKPNEDELNGGRFWKAEELTENMGKGVFTPNFENEYKNWIEHRKTTKR